MPSRDCSGCPLTARRAFLRDAALLASSALVMLGASPAGAVAAGFGRALRRLGGALVYAVPGEDGATIDEENQVILVRWEGALYAFALSCPHQNTALRWHARDARFQCPKHKSKYRPDGVFISGRATRSMDRFAIALRDGEVHVDLDTLYQQDESPDAWSAALVRL